MMLSAPAGNDILFDDKLCEQGRNFCNKIWNAFRLIKGLGGCRIRQFSLKALQKPLEWFEGKLGETVAEVNDLFSKFRISEALMAVYRLFWDEFSSWYLEMVKPAYGSLHRQRHICRHTRILRQPAADAPSIHAIHH